MILQRAAPKRLAGWKVTDDACIRALLQRSGYTQRRVAECIGGLAPQAVTDIERPRCRHLTHGPPGLVALVRLLLLGDAVDRRELAAHCAPLLRRLAAAGLIAFDGSHAVSSVRLIPWEGLLIPCDTLDYPEDEGAVLGVEPSTMTLANLTPRTPVGTALDLGTGSGAQALLAARHARQVTGVDSYDRAIDLAELGRDLNAAPHVHYRQGRWFEGADAEHYDLIVGNLPYLIGPSAVSNFANDADAPLSDSVSENAVRQTASRLSPGGAAVLLCSWIPSDPRAPTEPVRKWLGNSGCDGIVLQHGLQPALDYIAGQLQHLHHMPRDYERELDSWCHAFADSGISWVAWGAVILRRSAGTEPNWLAAFAAVRLPGRRSAAATERCFDWIGRLSRWPAGAFRDTCPRPVSGILAARHPAPPRAGVSEHAYAVELPEAHGVRVHVDGPAFGALERLDGHTPVEVALADVALDAREAALAQLEALAAAGLLELDRV